MPKRVSDKANSMVKVIDDGLFGIHKSENVLARLWRIILYETNMNGQIWHIQLNKFQDRLHRESTTKKSASIKGNITRMLADPKISWSAFMRGLSILEFEKMDIQITLYKKNKVLPLKTLTVDLNKQVSDLDDDDLNA